MNNWQKIVVSPEVTILEAMKIIDGAGTQFVMVLDDAGKLLGVVTDGDIRRGILRSVSLSAPVSEIMNHEPRCLLDKVSKSAAIAFLTEKHISHVPLVNTQKIVTGVISIEERLTLTETPHTAILMVGGLGTRLGELTANCPKPMLHVGGRPVLEVIVENLREHNFRDFIFCVNYRAEMIQQHFGDGSKLGVRIRYVHEDKRMGTAGALGLLPDDVQAPFLVMNGDIVTKVNFTRLMDFHKEHKAKATMGVRKYEFQIPFGVVETEQGNVVRIEEKPVHSFLVSAGIYVIESDCLRHLPCNEYFDMPQLFKAMMNTSDQTQAFPIHEYWLDIGHEDDLLRAKSDMVITLKEP